VRLTDAIVKKLPAPEKGNKVTWDEVPGFGVRVTAKGAKAFILNYRIGGRERRYTIGSSGEWSTSAARKHALDWKAAIRQGRDPLGEIEQWRDAQSIADLCDRFEEDYLPRLRPASRKLYSSAINGTARRKGIRAYFKHTRIDDLRHADAEAFHRYVSMTAPTMANRSIAVLSKLMSQATKWDLAPANPVRGIERNQEEQRTRYLSPEEIERLSSALAELEDRQAADVFRLLLLTGARKGEVLAMRWVDLDLDAGVWTKPAATTKQKRLHRVPLSAAAIGLLRGIEGGGEWVFPSAGKHRVEVKAQWENVCRAAGLVDTAGQKTVRMHDLRHTYASVLASAGLSLPVIGALLGHTQAQTTARYSHLLDDPLRAATERASAVVTGKKNADGVKLHD
jgi:integrase